MKDISEIQKEISKEMMHVATKPLCINRREKLEELNLMLDSVNRAAYYLKNGKAKVSNDRK